MLSGNIQADNILGEFLRDHNDDMKKQNLVRACSEALIFATAKCFSPENVYDGFKQSFYEVDEEAGNKNTKLMIKVFNGGKASGSAVKFSRFYLIIDAMSQGQKGVDPIEIPKYYRKFLIALKKSIQATKAGEAGFKISLDGSYFNANLTIGESFKMIEDAIVSSGANEDERKLFQVGLNCDADAYFNKEPKDPMKYEQEGQKVLFDSDAMLDYYSKMIKEHPLLTYIEDAFAQYEFEAHRNLKEMLQSPEYSHVSMGLNKLFNTGKLERLREVTAFSEFDGGDTTEDKNEASNEKLG